MIGSKGNNQEIPNDEPKQEIEKENKLENNKEKSVDDKSENLNEEDIPF